MISKIEGILAELEGNMAQLRLPMGLTYQVLLSGYTASRLGQSIGQPVTLCTLEYYEAQGQGSHLLPRLVGFLNAEDRAFFELFITCKGIGQRKALRAMALASSQIAAAIADRDIALLQSLPEIGRRTAETLVASLHGKVDRFLNVSMNDGEQGQSPPAAVGPGAGRGRGRGKQGAAGAVVAEVGQDAAVDAAAAVPAGGIAGGSGGASGGTSGGAGVPVGVAMTRQVLQVLLQMGENRVQALQWIDQATRDPGNRPGDAAELIRRVLQIRTNQ